MERDEVDKTCGLGTSDAIDAIDSRCAVNSLILDYYKKFGRKRDLEQYFSLSTAQSDIKDTSGLFWRKMKTENDSSDSGGRKSDSSHEVCRISIRCSLPDPSSSQEDEPKTKTESPQTPSPPIIIEEVPADVSRHTDEESINFDDNNSQKSFDALLDLSAHKPLSPTSSITSQRKLEWDSLADVGYANESDRKNSASSLSTLERLALKQQYSNNDTKLDIGPPTSHSTPLEENDSKSKGKKGIGKKTTKIYKKDVDFVEVNVPTTSDTNQAPSINVNLTKHISFNVEKDGGITVDNIKRDLNISPEKVSRETEAMPCLGMDKEIQTSMTRDKSSFKEKSSWMDEAPKQVDPYSQNIPVMISLNTLRKRLRRNKYKVARRKLRTKKKVEAKKELTPLEKSGEQLSAAESFEYMPGHMYNQNQIQINDPRPDNSTAGNKSSLESSGPLTESSKGSKHSLTKDLEKCVDVLRITLQKRYDDSNTKKKLIKEIVNRLITSKYRDDDTTTEFLSGLSYSSNKLGLTGNNTTTSTSDANNTDDSKHKSPKKSILRSDKFNPNVVASTSQSAPNLYSASSEKVNSTLLKMTSNTESDSSKGKTSSDNGFPKTSSEQLYLKYLEAIKREEAYKQHLKDKETFLKQKLVSSDNVFKLPIRQEPKINRRLKDLMKDLTRNNYDDGSGDASKLEGGSSTNIDLERFNGVRNQRSHSVFTLSSSHSEPKRPNLKKKMQPERESDEAGPSQHHYCCCPHHYINKVGYTDSSVQVNIKCEYDPSNDKPCQTKSKACAIIPIDSNKRSKPNSPRTRVVPDNVTGEIKYVCLCNGKQVSSSEVGDNFMIYKCSRLTNRGVQLEDPTRAYNRGIQCGICQVCEAFNDDKIEQIQPPCKMNTTTDSSSSDHTSKARRFSKSSQTNIGPIKMCQGFDKNYPSGSSKKICGTSTRCVIGTAGLKKKVKIHEATRCLQTEISINPRIADPTLSDIVIVNNCDCAKLITEQLRMVSRRSSEKSEGEKTYSDVGSNSISEKLLIPFGDNIFRDEIKPSETNSNEAKETSSGQSALSLANEFTLPIQGTNMTVTVNIGSADLNENPEQVNQAVATEKIAIGDEVTSDNDKYTKPSCSCASSVSQNINTNSPKGTPISPRRTFLAREVRLLSDKRNTYPKSEPVKEKPPFRRSDTDTDKLNSCCVQTYEMKQSNAETNNSRKTVLPDSLPKTCENGCQVGNKYDYVQRKPEEIQKDSEIIEAKEKTPHRRVYGGISNSNSCYAQTDEIKQSNAETYNGQKTIITERSKGKNDDNVQRKPDEVQRDAETFEVQEKTLSRRVYAGIGNSNSCCAQTDDIKKSTAETNNIQKTIIPVSPTKTCENGCQVGKIDDNKEQRKEEGVDPSVKSSCKCPKKQLVQIDKRHMGIQKDLSDDSTSDKTLSEKPFFCFRNIDMDTSEIITKSVGIATEAEPKAKVGCVGCQTDNQEKAKIQENDSKTRSSDSGMKDSAEKLQQESCCSKTFSKSGTKGPVIEMIHDLTRRYSKKELLKVRKKKCFTEIMTVLNYLLETEDSTDPEPKICFSTSTETKSSSDKSKRQKKSIGDCCSEKQVDKSVQFSCTKSCKSNKNEKTESSDLPCSSDLPTTSSESAACRVLNKIKKECEKYHHKKCKSGKKCEVSSSTSVDCEKCKKVHHCQCRNHKCKRSKTFEKLQKKCIAYNLIIQTSESMISEETVCEKKSRPLQNIIVKVPKRKENENKEAIYHKTECSPRCSPRCRKSRSRSCPNESETSDEYARRVELGTVREYLEQNRPDFVEKTSERQNCLQFIRERRSVESAAHRHLLSLHVDQQPDLTNLSSDELRKLAQQIGLDLRRKKPAPKFISERDMKKHSENIYKTLPEVVQKKEEKRKENIKKTNLLMANIFKKNLQKQTLRGSVNLSNYSTVIKI